MTNADFEFKKLCTEILENGYMNTNDVVRPKWEDGSPAHTKKIFSYCTKYDLSEEFPILTYRKINLKAAIDEILWIWQKKSNNVKDLNSKIWRQWANTDKESESHIPYNTIGKAYGYQLGRKFDFPEGNMDQVDWLLYQLKHTPASRRMVTNIFVHEDLKDMGLQPCAYSITLGVVGNKLNMILNQRSQDVLVANNWNVVQYAILLHMFAQCAGLEAGVLTHMVADAHIYDRHIPIVESIISVKNTLTAPKLIIKNDTKNFYDFKVDDFELEGYEWMEDVKKIPVAI